MNHISRSARLAYALCMLAPAAWGAVLDLSPAPDAIAVHRGQAGPGVELIVQNKSASARKYFLRSSLSGKCLTHPSWKRTQIADRRLGESAMIVLDPGAWAVKFIMFSAEDEGCPFKWMTWEGDEGPSFKMLRLPATYAMPMLYPSEPGDVAKFITVVADRLKGAVEPSEDSIQVQVQVLLLNRSSEDRIVAIVGRRLECVGSAKFDWLIGPGEAPAELSSGPTLLAQRSWTAFSQRVRGSGDSSDCLAIFQLAELRSVKGDHFSSPTWQSIGAVQVHLIPVAHAEYIL